MKKRKLSFWEIWHMSFGFLGIQFGFALQNANVSRIFETLGAKIDQIPILWIAAPLTGLIVQPIVGYLSDRTWTRLGRRRPYFLVGAILSTIALFIMPNSPVLWVAATMLWILDLSINISMEPFRAFVADNLSNEQRTQGFAMQSFFIGVGAVLGSILPWVLSHWFHISNTAPEGVIPDSVKWSFYIGGIVFLTTVLWTVIKSKEYSPEEMADFELSSHNEGKQIVVNKERTIIKMRWAGWTFIIFSTLFYMVLVRYQLEKELYILAGGLFLAGLSFLFSVWLMNQGKHNAFIQINSDLVNMPKTMQQLAWVQFFTWFALFSMWIYTTQAVTHHIYHATDTTSKLYNEGADWVGVLFTVYNGVAALVAFLLPVIAKKTSRRFTHFLALILGGLGLLSFYFITNPYLLLISMIGVGVAWASILSMPYAMLSSALPPEKMGYFMGVFNFFIVIPQLIAATILGFLVSKFFHNDPVYALVVGGLSMFLAAFLTLRVQDHDK
ncbi:MAG TPA: MFS transporter [Flavobacteriales bacterium]|nr:MFS transporter [Flavobacteriales bacterium]